MVKKIATVMMNRCEKFGKARTKDEEVMAKVKVFAHLRLQRSQSYDNNSTFFSEKKDKLINC